jgi:hypothetical protein
MKTFNFFFRSFALGLVVFLLWPISSIAANSDEAWRFSVSPYLWITGQEGEVATLPPAAPAEIDISFSDVIDSLDLSLMVFLEARKERYGVFSEIFAISVSEDVDTPGPFFTGADFEQDFFGLTLGASYALVQSNSSFLDVAAGVRFWFLDTELDLEPGISAVGKASEKENWEDYIVGVKGRHKINEQWYLNGWGMIAIAGDSDSAWDVLAGIQYERSSSLHFTAGYRHQEVDYDKDEFLFDVELSGPILGATFRW